MSKNKFIGDKEKISILEEGIKADLSFFNNFNYFLGEGIAIASLLGKYQFDHGVDLNNGFLVEDDLESFKRENNKTIAFIKEVITNNNLTNAYDQRIADADNKIANIINEMIFKEGGIAHVNGLDNVYFSTECKDKASEYFPCVYPTAAGSIPPDNRMTLDDYLKMEDLMPPNLKAAINQPKVNLENQQKLLQNLLNDATLTPEQKKQLNKQLSNISATLDNPDLKAIDLIYLNATWGKQLISENHQKYGDLYLVIDTLWNAATIAIGLFTYGIGTAIMVGIDLISAGYQYTMLNTSGRNLVTGENATSAEYQAATFNLFAEGVSLVGGHLINNTKPVGRSIANQLSETKLGQRLMSSEAYRVYTHAKDQLGVAVKPVVNKIQQTIDDIKLGITKPIVGGLDKVEDFFDDLVKKYDKSYTLHPNAHLGVVPHFKENTNILDGYVLNGEIKHLKPIKHALNPDRLPDLSLSDLIPASSEKMAFSGNPKIAIAILHDNADLELLKGYPHNLAVLDNADIEIYLKDTVGHGNIEPILDGYLYNPNTDKTWQVIVQTNQQQPRQLKKVIVYHKGQRFIDYHFDDREAHFHVYNRVPNGKDQYGNTIYELQRDGTHYHGNIDWEQILKGDN